MLCSSTSPLSTFRARKQRRAKYPAVATRGMIIMGNPMDNRSWVSIWDPIAGAVLLEDMSASVDWRRGYQDSTGLPKL
jgi:hypothetical protein